MSKKERKMRQKEKKVVLALLMLIFVTMSMLFAKSFNFQEHHVIKQEISNILRSMSRFNVSPAEGINQDREENWRLSVQRFSEDSLGVLFDKKKYTLSYNLNDGSVVDSVLMETFIPEVGWWPFSQYVLNYTDEGLINDYIIYFVFPTQNGLVKTPLMYVDCLYDNGKLSKITARMGSDEDGYVDVHRQHFYYENDLLTKLNIWNAESMSIDSMHVFEKLTFTHDSEGRIFTRLHENSGDSLTWFMKERMTYMYDEDDTMNGLLQTMFIAQDYVYNEMMLEPMYLGMLSDVLQEKYISGQWVFKYQEMYLYNESNLLETISQQKWAGNDEWEDYSESLFSYDSGRLTQTVNRLWNPITEAWEDSSGVTKEWEAYTGNEETGTPLISQFGIKSYPNPFKGDVNIKGLTESSLPVNLSIFNIKGQLVYSASFPGNQKHIWNGKSSDGSYLSSGVYMCKLSQNGKSVNKKVLKIK